MRVIKKGTRKRVICHDYFYCNPLRF